VTSSHEILKVYATRSAKENGWIVRWLHDDMRVDCVDQINGLIPFRLTPVKLASLVHRGNIQVATSECSDTMKVCGEDGGSSDTRVWQGSKRRPLSPLFGWDGREGRGGIHQTSNLRVCQGSREHRRSDGAPILHSLATFLSEGGLVDPQLRASSEHSFIVRALRA
jgi:hypothetical protein